MNRSRALVSNWIADLELQWQVQLLDRAGKLPVLTAHAQKLLPYMEEVINDTRRLEQAVKSLKDLSINKLTLGFDYLLPAEFQIPLISRLWSQFPEMELEVKHLPGNELISQLKSKNVDVGFGDCALADLDSFQVKEVGLYQFVLCCHPDFPLADYEEIRDIDLAVHKTILIKGLKERFHGKNIIELPDYTSVIALTKAGMGFCLCPLEYVREDITKGTLVILNTNMAVNRLQIGYYWLKDKSINDYSHFLFKQMETIWGQGEIISSQAE